MLRVKGDVFYVCMCTIYRLSGLFQYNATGVESLLINSPRMAMPELLIPFHHFQHPRAHVFTYTDRKRVAHTRLPCISLYSAELRRARSGIPRSFSGLGVTFVPCNQGSLAPRLGVAARVEIAVRVYALGGQLVWAVVNVVFVYPNGYARRRSCCCLS